MGDNSENTPPASIRHLKQKALARRWDTSTRTLERWRVAGTGPSYIKLNGRVVYRLEDVVAFELDRLRTCTGASAATGGAR